MCPEEAGYTLGYKNVTDSSKGTRADTAENKILRYLEKCEIAQLPKIISLRTGINLNTAKVTLSRMYHRRLLDRDVTGYTLPVTSFEQQMSKELNISLQKASLPKVHDIHLIFKPENVREAHKCVETQGLFFKMEYLNETQGPDSDELHNPLIPGFQNTPSLPKRRLDLSDFLSKIFNPLDPSSLYQIWKEDAGKTSVISGGFQEVFSLGDYSIIVQLFGTGTLKVIISNSEHPFGAPELRQALSQIDALFVARTGVSFLDISSFFYFEKVHVGSDVMAEREFSGITRLNCTVQQFDGWLYRTYEKILGDELYIRQEACLESGSIKDTGVNAMLSMIQGGITPNIVLAGLYKVQKDQEELRSGLLVLTKQASQTYKMIQYHMKGETGNKDKELIHG